VPAETHSQQQPFDRDAITTIVCEQLADILGIDVDAVTVDARLREDLDADDFALIDLADAVEAEVGERSVGVTLDDDDLAEVRTVGDAVEILVARLAASSGS
jgi:acyl carrier protein